LNEDNHDDVLNVPISEAEIKNVIFHLHNDKSSGLDNVTNEYLKDTVYFMIPPISSDKLANLLFSMPVNTFPKQLIKVIAL
jgi:hypothetical protein